jgi:hypothetical protein
MRRRLFLKITIVVAAMVLLNLQIGRNTGAGAVQSPWRELFSGSIAADVVVLGSSHAARGISPNVLEREGLSAWNFAEGGNSPKATCKWYRRIFKKCCRKPAVVLYQVDWFLFDPDWLGREYEQYSRNFPTSFLLAEMTDGVNNREALLMNRVPLFTDLDLRWLVRKKEAAPGARYHGFLPMTKKPSKLEVQEMISTRNDSGQQAAFLELLDSLQQDGIKVVFVQAPELVEARGCPRIESNTRYLEQVARQRQITFLNYNKERLSSLNYCTQYYNDWGHLNASGADAFTQLLSNDLKRLKLL